MDLRKLREVAIPEGAERVGNHWFYNCVVESVTIPASVKSIGTEAFCGCYDLRSVAFADGSRLERLDKGCFCESGISQITIPSGVTVIDDFAFHRCQRLRRVAFQKESGLKLIGDECFRASAIEELTFPCGITAIGSCAFSECKLLTAISLQKYCRLKKIGKDAFLPCAGLRFVALHARPDVNGTILCNGSIEEIIIPKMAGKLAPSMLKDCKTLKIVWVSDDGPTDIQKYVRPQTVILRRSSA